MFRVKNCVKLLYTYLGEGKNERERETIQATARKTQMRIEFLLILIGSI